MKCKSGYKLNNGKCSKKRFSSEGKEMKVFSTKEDNNPIVWISGISVFLSLLLYVVYPPLRGATAIYGAMSLVSLFFYTNPAFQSYLIGIPRKKFLSTLLIGVGAGLGFVILPKIIPGLSMGLPVLPASVESSMKWIIICIFAPFVEEIATRGALLGFIKYLGRNNHSNNKIIWIAIISQAVFFMLLHALAYAVGWYQAPTWLGSLGLFSAVIGSLLVAFLFAIIMGFLVSRKGINSLVTSIVSHYIVNQILFIQAVKLFVGG
jgi:membrane protease YdiL (CAAX protease family)